MPSSNNQRPGSMTINHELDLFYGTLVVCGYLKCKRLKKNPQRVTLSHYIYDQLPRVDGLIPPTTVKNPIGDTKKTHMNISICSFFDKLEARSTKFHPNLTIPSPSFESTEISNEPKYDINTTQNICTRRSKNLYELREKMSKYTLKSVQLLQGSNDFPLPIHLQSKCQISDNRTLYGAWPSSMFVPNVGTEFSFCGNSCMIVKSNIDVSNLGLFILSHVFVPPKQSVPLMPFFGPLYSWFDYLNIVKYKHNISMYSMCMNGYASRNINMKNLFEKCHKKKLLMEPFPYLHGKACGRIDTMCLDCDPPVGNAPAPVASPPWNNGHTTGSFPYRHGVRRKSQNVI